MKVLVTGAAGFIGAHVSKRLCECGHDVVGIDNLNAYYDVSLKRARVDWVNKHSNFTFNVLDICDINQINSLFEQAGFDIVIHLAAQAGVRHSLEDPKAYIDSNLVGFFSIIDAAKKHNVKHFMYASSSSVYGANDNIPYSEDDNVDQPLSLYAATKKSNELMAYSYSSLYQLPTTGLRFFTVYGPWGRPDMALFKFTKAIMAGESIDIYNHGQLSRDFTYIDDIVDGILKVALKPQVENIDSEDTSRANQATSNYQVLNIGTGSPVKLLDFVSELESAIGQEANKQFLPMQKGDLLTTWADLSKFEQCYGASANTLFSDGVRNFVNWYRLYYG